MESFLKRQGFAQIAISPAVRSYLDTYSYLQQSGATESHGTSSQSPLEQGQFEQISEPKSMNYSNAQQDATHRRADYPLGSSQLPPRDAQNGPPNSAFTNQSLPLNQPNLSIQGDQTVRIEALLDYDGIVDLEHKIAALKMLIKRKTKAAEPVAQDSSPDLDDVLS